jgi:hypothetical protein
MYIAVKYISSQVSWAMCTRPTELVAFHYLGLVNYEHECV